MMPDWEKDYLAGRRLLELAGLQVFEAPMHVEGGSIHSDGQGCEVHKSKYRTGFRLHSNLVL